NIAIWNGSSWSNLGLGVDNYIETIHNIGNDIYVTGPFLNAGGFSAIGYAKWNGNSWQSLANGGPFANAMTNIGNELYVGGQFNTINGGTVAVNNLARWDGISWSDVGGGVSQGTNFQTGVYALASRGNELIVGGNFTIAGSTPANNIAIWNGSQWTALGNGLNGTVRAILVSGNEIYVGGQFTTAGGNLAFSIARWDGANWYPLGKGINQSNNFVSIATVNALLPSPYGLYVSGQFTHAGDKYSNMIALYTDFTTSVPEEEFILPSEYFLSQNYPNPFNPTTKIKYSIPNVGSGLAQTVLKVYDVLGNEVATLVDEEKPAGSYEINFDASELSSGIYFYKLQAGLFVETRKMVLLR
ncbi:T9SS type A sorting domain-containing protein, partial [Ignavibacterium sp.]|uniref:T9SS type A sorting domain-containing protein n=1 Tax=Ignavibacterium sp. TaxID=2651167 RepID=UPI003297E850